jgi:hypothetical protein
VSFDELLRRSQLQTTIIHVDRWGIDVEIREMSMREVESLRAKATDRKGQLDQSKLARLFVVASCVNPSFTYEQVTDLYEASPVPLDQIGAAIVSFNNIGEDASVNAEEVFPGAE